MARMVLRDEQPPARAGVDALPSEECCWRGTRRVQKTLSPVLKAKALDDRLPNPILGDAYAEQVMRLLDPDYDKGTFDASQLGLAAMERARAHDEWARGFLGNHRQAVVLHLGWVSSISAMDRPGLN